MSTKLVMPSKHLILCHPLLLPPPSFPASGSCPMSQLFTSGGQRIGVSFNISPDVEGCSGLISFRIDWLDLLAIQGTLKSLLQHYSSKASILRCSAFFIVQLSHPYMTTGSLRPTLTSKELSFLVLDHLLCLLPSLCNLSPRALWNFIHDKLSLAHNHVTVGLPFTSSG